MNIIDLIGILLSMIVVFVVEKFIYQKRVEREYEKNKHDHKDYY